MMSVDDTICAVSTPSGSGGVALIRVSGKEAIAISEQIFVARNGAKLADTESNKIVYGYIKNSQPSASNPQPSTSSTFPLLPSNFYLLPLLDSVLVSVFRAPHSYTGEDTVEISCHGSLYIQQQLLQFLVESGARLAHPGEFTQRAFLNGKMDLSQAEAVADLIASTSAGMHRLAINQMRGGFSDELQRLRARLLEFTSLIELELDFSDHEDLEFADRKALRDLAVEIQGKIHDLAVSFATGNAIKNGIPVAIIGKPNVGKSTLLNALLNEERAIVSEIPGTTRDTIEEILNIEGRMFRIIDTAGLRDNTTDSIEAQGIRRSFEKAEKASIILYLYDLTQEEREDLVATSQWLQKFNKPILMIGTKNDLMRRSPIHTFGNVKAINISCREKADIERVKSYILSISNVGGESENAVIVTNVRHYEALCQAGEDIERVLEGLDSQLSGDLLSEDIRDCLRHLAEITGGEILPDEILSNIFSKFCIGK